MGTNPRSVLGAIVAVGLVVSCGADGASPSTPSRSPTSPSPSPSPLPDVCDYFPEVGDIYKDVRAGTELPDDIVARLDEAQDVLADLAENESRNDVARALRKAEDAAGRLKVAVADADTDYASDQTVALQRETGSLTLFTVALEANCADIPGA